MPIIPPRDVERAWKILEQAIEHAPPPVKNATGLNKRTLKAVGEAALPNVPARYRRRIDPVKLGATILHSEIDRAAKMQTNGARQRLDAFNAAQNRRTTSGNAVAAARLRRFQLDSALTARGL